MNNIFPGEGQGLPNPLIGMPDFSTGQPQEMAPMQQPAIQRIAQGVNSQPVQHVIPQKPMWNPPLTEPKNVVYKAPRSDEYATDLIMGTTARDKQAAAERLIGTRGANNQGDLLIKQRKQALAEKIAAGKATDAEKQQWILDQIDARGDNTMEQINARGDNSIEQINRRGDIQSGLQDKKGNQALAQIGARITGQKDLVGLRAENKPELPSQTKTRQENTVRELINTRPELSKFIKMENDGSFSIVPSGGKDFWGNATGPTKDQFDEVNRLIYGSKPAVKLGGTTSSSTTPTSKTPTSTTPTSSTKPTAASLIEKYSK